MNNINPAEIHKFTDMAHHWWDATGPCRPLHELNPVRLSFIQRYAALYGQKVLDVGCGGGILSESMAKLGAEVSGIDMSASVLEIARLHALEGNLRIQYHEMPVEDFAHDHAGEFQALTCMEMLEHVPDPQSVVNACAQLVAPGGYVFFSTLNRNMISYLQAIVGAEYILGLLPRGTHDYKSFIKPSELAKWLREADLRLVDMCGLTYNPLTRQYRLTSNTDVNYLLCAQKSHD